MPRSTKNISLSSSTSPSRTMTSPRANFATDTPRANTSLCVALRFANTGTRASVSALRLTTNARSTPVTPSKSANISA